MRNSKNTETGAEGGSEIKGNLEDEVDALFKLPVGEFIGARNDLAARLKRAGHANDASRVKALAKPSVSAWAVNQLYWNHREAFDRLLAVGQRLSQTQAAVGKPSDMRESADARREAVSHLSELAASLLSDTGHGSAPDTIHRITTTLEAVSAYASLSDGPTPGRLTRDVDPPGFESLASLMAGAVTSKAKDLPADAVTPQASERPAAGAVTTNTNEELTPVTPAQESGTAATRSSQEAPPSADVQKARELEEKRRARIDAAEDLLDHVRRSLAEATATAERLEAAREKAYAEVKEAEMELRESEERLKKASAASRDATERSRRIAAEAQDAVRAVEDARRNVEKASKELESLSRELPAG